MAFESLRERSKLSLVRSGAFYLSVLVFVFFWLLAFNFQLYAVFAVWFDADLANTVHFVHDIALASWVWVWGAAMLVQLYRPAKRVTAMQVALIMTVIDAAPGLIQGTFETGAMLFFGPIFLAAALHPARGELLPLGGFDRESIDPVVLGLAALAVVPVVLYVLGQLNFQATLADEHAELGHYGTMSYFSLSFVALAALAAFRNRGRRFAAYGAGLLAALFGVASVFQPTMSGLPPVWAAIAMLWAVAVVGAYEWSVRDDTARPPVRAGDSEQPAS